MIIFHNFEHCFLPTLLKELKKTRHTTSCNTLVTLCSSNISHLLNHLKTLRKGPKWPKALKNYHFHNFEHSSLPISIIKQNKNDLARNFMWHFYHVMKFQYKLLLNPLSAKFTKWSNTLKQVCFTILWDWCLKV